MNHNDRNMNYGLILRMSKDVDLTDTKYCATVEDLRTTKQDHWKSKAKGPNQMKRIALGRIHYRVLHTMRRRAI